jgi:hypothetical protein
VELRRGNLGGVNLHRAHDHPRWGFRRAYHAARVEGWYVNHKRLGSSTTITTIADAQPGVGGGFTPGVELRVS